MNMSQHDKDVIFFVAWLLNKIADVYGKTASEIYRSLQSANIVNDYLIPSYDVLHTMGELALIEDVQIVAAKRGVAL